VRVDGWAGGQAGGRLDGGWSNSWSGGLELTLVGGEALFNTAVAGTLWVGALCWREWEARSAELAPSPC
jgi:hypothetical protein